MAKTYRLSVEEAKTFLQKKIQELIGQIPTEVISDILYTSSIFGLQRVTDISYWLKDFKTTAGASVLDPALLEELRSTLLGILDSWEIPRGYGEFVKSKNVAMRPLFSSDVPIRPLVEKLHSVVKPNWNNRISFKLPVSISTSFPYALRVPTRFISHADEENSLSLVYIDWNHQKTLSWVEAGKILKRWEAQGILLYHGALEIPANQFLSRNDLLPYYALLRLPTSGEQFLREEGLLGHALQLLGPESYSDDFEDLAEDNETPSLLKEAERRKLRAHSPQKLDPETETDQVLPSPHLVAKTLEPLSLIPFRVEDIQNPDYTWPKPMAEIRMMETEGNVETDLVVIDEKPRLSVETPPTKKLKVGKKIKPPKPWKMRLRLAPKLMMMMAFFLVLSLLTVTTFSVIFFKQDAASRVEDSNLQIVTMTALSVQTSFRAMEEKTRIIYNSALLNPEKSSALIESFWETNPRVLAIGIATEPSAPTYNNTTLINDLKLDAGKFQSLFLGESERWKKSQIGEYLVTNSTLFLQVPSLVLSFPWEYLGKIHTLFAVTTIDPSFQETVASNGLAESFVLNDRNDLILHNDPEQLSNPQLFRGHPIVDRIQTAQTDRQNFIYNETGMDNYFASIKLIPSYGLVAVSRVSETKILEGVRFIEYGNYFFTGALIFVVMIFILFFSRSITKPLGKLTDAADKIMKGDFDISIKPSSKDEVGFLSLRFNEMSKGLSEREKLKDAFGRFVNKEIAELASRGELKLGGERKDATIFFSDIRSFTAMSEILPPEEVVVLLNEYFSKMVNIIFSTNGIVDKYIGDAIMATWGVPLSHGNDAFNAVDSALLMRKALLEMNALRKSRKKPEFHIGCGINTGPVLAGQIGSQDKMEYTVIGDAVNLASRIESLNKPMGTDILISQQTYELVRETFHTQPMEKITVKGKTDVLQIYAVLGRRDDPQCPKDLVDLRLKFGISEPKGSAGEEEVKYSIKGGKSP